MRIGYFLTAAAASLGALAIAATAQAASTKILSLGGADEQAVMSPGVSVKTVAGVRFYRGASIPEDRQLNVMVSAPRPAKPAAATHACACVIPPRHLRTHGMFFVGEPAGRRFTHGFLYGD